MSLAQTRHMGKSGYTSAYEQRYLTLSPNFWAAIKYKNTNILHKRILANRLPLFLYTIWREDIKPLN